MSQQPAPGAPPPSGQNEAPETGRARPVPPPEEPTVGTGSVVAIGCVVAMLLVLAVGIVIVLLIR